MLKSSLSNIEVENLAKSNDLQNNFITVPSMDVIFKLTKTSYSDKKDFIKSEADKTGESEKDTIVLDKTKDLPQINEMSVPTAPTNIAITDK